MESDRQKEIILKIGKYTLIHSVFEINYKIFAIGVLMV